MRSNALRKTDASSFDYVQDNVKPAAEAWDVKRARIAQAANEACNLAGNETSPDFEAFTARYATKSGSGFA